ncbi:RNA polymerase sigma factor [Sanyastnella coralliicola]|uniref:RNA polymerase sigma factor n=1 Tax=Sanyastnella coralliicola TaxID=3069118 RepID=UPI0027B8AF52|nr:sigma-70 family RNA polymerase sigma factor [Longitalea sp. SCSIO 12813]
MRLLYGMGLRWKKKQLDDLALVREYQRSGDKALVGTLYERYVDLVLGVCLKYLKNQQDAEDATMQIFEQLMEKLKKAEISNFKSWLWSVTRNHCLMQLRKQQPEVTEVNESQFVAESNMHELLVKEAKLNQLERVINELSDDQRKCITAFYLERKSYQQISDELNMELKKVKSHIQNGKRNLSLKMMNDGEAE